MKRADLMMIKTMPGDVVLVQGLDTLGTLIRKFETSKNEPKTLVNHVGIIPDIGYGCLCETRIIEALTTVKNHSLWEEYAIKNAKIAIYRMHADCAALAGKFAREYVGRKYGYLKIVAHLADYAIGGRYFFRKLAKMDRYPICSWVVAQAYLKAVGLRFYGVPAEYAQPDDIADEVMYESFEWSCILPLTKISEVRE